MTGGLGILLEGTERLGGLNNGGGGGMLGNILGFLFISLSNSGSSTKSLWNE